MRKAAKVREQRSSDRQDICLCKMNEKRIQWNLKVDQFRYTRRQVENSG